MACIYQIRNIVNDKVYIGSTNNFKNRKNTHITALNKNTHINKYLQNAWNKYGGDNFKFEILEDNIPEEDKFNVENDYFQRLKPFGDNGYNIKTTAFGFASGMDHPSSVLKYEEVCIIKTMLYEGYTCGEISRKIDIPYNSIYQIAMLKTHLDTASKLNKHLGDKWVKNSKERKERKFLEAIGMYIMGFSVKQIADEIGFSEICVRNKIFKYEAKISGKTISCFECGKEIVKNSNRQKYCKKCKSKKEKEQSHQRYLRRKSREKESKNNTGGDCHKLT